MHGKSSSRHQSGTPPTQIVIAELLEEDRSIARGKELLGFVLYFGVLDRCDLGSLDHGCLIVMDTFLALLIEPVFIDS
jgi:hypothetical protein